MKGVDPSGAGRGGVGSCVRVPPTDEIGTAITVPSSALHCVCLHRALIALALGGAVAF